jgi:hypothetical protein
MRLCDLGETDTLRVSCTRCGNLVEILPRRRQVLGWHKSEKRIDALKWRCQKCNATEGFRLSILDERRRGDSSQQSERVISG